MDQIAETVAADASGRYANLEFVTIDGPGTKDIDDALFIEKREVGYRIVVAIANPVKLVAIGSTEDEQARLMAATAYIRDKAVRRMLPPAISEHKGSLVAGAERAALVFDIALDETLEPVTTTLSVAPIKVAHRLCHADIPQIVGDGTNPLQPMLTLASHLGRLLLDTRRRKGALALYDLSRMLITDEDGRLQVLHSVDEVIGYIIVQEMMILTNHEAAKWMIERDIPCIFRNHEPRLAAPRSDELAHTIEGWIKGGSFDQGNAYSQFMAIAGKANYGGAARGHYGLSLPAYLHVSSPLRRYADLVNMRQLVAFLKERPLPYSKSELEAMAQDLNDALERRKEERSDGFKDVVRRTAEGALESGRLAKLADHELRQAVKLSKEAGYLPAVLADELVRRFNTATITDLVANTLLSEVPLSVLTEDIRSAMARWISEAPSRSMQLLHHGQQTGFFTEVSVKSADSGSSGFEASAEILCSNEQRFTGRAAGGRKRDAEQLAVFAVLSQVLQLPEVATSIEASAPTSNKNYKGAMLEFCQKHQLPMATFECQGKGPSNAMIFSCRASVTIKGQEYVATATNASTKRDAEALAAKSLLDQVRPLAPKGAAQKNSNGGGNPVGELQELAQKGRFPVPTYEVVQIEDMPPLFKCTVTTFKDGPSAFVAEGANKQAAKTKAAELALKSA